MESLLSSTSESSLESACQKILLLIVLLLAAALFPLSADNSSLICIDEIKFSISGKTNENLLLSELNIQEGDTFASLDELKQAVDLERQNLFNRRIFEDVEVKLIRAAENNHYKVHYTVTDASTLLVLPYAKYDSNYGGKIGIKLYEKNLLGRLSNLYLYSGIRQLNFDDFESFHLDSDLNISDFRIVDQNFNLSANLSIDNDQGVLDNGIFSTSIVLNHLTLGKQYLDLFSSVYITQVEGTEDTLWKNPILSLGFHLQGMKLFTEDFSFYFNTEVDASSNGFDDPNITLTSKATLPSVSVLSRIFGVYLQDDYKFQIGGTDALSHTIVTGISHTIPFPWFNYAVSASVTSEFIPDSFSSITVGTTHTISAGKIDWFDNLRNGGYTTVTLSTSMPVDSGTSAMISELSTVTRITSTNFYKYKNLFSFSFRANSFIATKAAVTFGFEPGEFVRGILNKNIPDAYGYKGLVLNTNMTFRFFDFTLYIFGKSPDGQVLLSPFVDVALFDSHEDLFTFDPDYVRYSGGLETYIIFDRYRSYPLCATLGVDLEDALDILQGKKGLPDMEFELILSLNMSY